VLDLPSPLRWPHSSRRLLPTPGRPHARAVRRLPHPRPSRAPADAPADLRVPDAALHPAGAAEVGGPLGAAIAHGTRITLRSESTVDRDARLLSHALRYERASRRRDRARGRALAITWYDAAEINRAPRVRRASTTWRSSRRRGRAMRQGFGVRATARGDDHQLPDAPTAGAPAAARESARRAGRSDDHEPPLRAPPDVITMPPTVHCRLLEIGLRLRLPLLARHDQLGDGERDDVDREYDERARTPRTMIGNIAQNGMRKTYRNQPCRASARR